MRKSVILKGGGNLRHRFIVKDFNNIGQISHGGSYPAAKRGKGRLLFRRPIVGKLCLRGGFDGNFRYIVSAVG